MMGDAEPSLPRRRSRLPAAILTACCLVGLLLAVEGLRAVTGVPAWVGEAFGDAGFVSLLTVAVLLLWIGLSSAWVGLLILRNPKWGLGLPAYAAVLAATYLGLYHLSAGGLPGAEGAGGDVARLLLLTAYAVLILVCASAAVGAANLLGWAWASKCVVFLILMGAPWAVLAHIVLSKQTDAWWAAELVRVDPFSGQVFLVLLVLLIAANGAALGYALRRPRWGTVVYALFATALVTVPGWVLLRLALAPEVVSDGTFVPTLRLILAPEGAGWLSDGSLLLRWVAVQTGLVVVLAAGHVCLLRLAIVEPSGDEEAAWPADALAARGEGAPAIAHGRAYLVMTYVFALLVTYGSLVPLAYRDLPFEEALRGFLETPYLSLGIANRADLVANILLFIPLTFVALGALARENQRGGRWLLALLVLVGAAALSVGIEFTQLRFEPRTVSLNDILAECTGAVIGVVAWFLTGARVTRWWRQLLRLRRPRKVASALLAGYVVGLVLYQLFPYDLVLSMAELTLKFEQGKIALLPLAGAGGVARLLYLGKVVVYVPVGYWLAVRRPGVRRPVLKALGLGLVLALLLELGQVAIFSRYASLADVILGAVGAGMGGWLAAHFGPAALRPLPRGLVWRIAAFVVLLAGAVAVGGALVWGKWSPLEFTWPAQGVGAAVLATCEVPFFHQYWSSEFEAAAQMLRDTLVPAALGVMVMGVSSRLLGRTRVVAATIAGLVGGAVELGQIFFPPHTADMTTAVLAAAAGAAGAFLYRPFVKVFVQTPRRLGRSKTGREAHAAQEPEAGTT